MQICIAQFDESLLSHAHESVINTETPREFLLQIKDAHTLHLEFFFANGRSFQRMDRMDRQAGQRRVISGTNESSKVF